MIGRITKTTMTKLLLDVSMRQAHIVLLGVVFVDGYTKLPMNVKPGTHRVVRSFDRVEVEDSEVPQRFGVLKCRIDLREIVFLHG
ncbi:hypothetical protein [Paenibacillus sp. SI8]|uniref:hypothetical protein n=1 Tax=unclassified Paenibacillus TaxID=185978 RepID=UPI003465E849